MSTPEGAAEAVVAGTATIVDTSSTPVPMTAASLESDLRK
jgi:hypothetical protein